MPFISEVEAIFIQRFYTGWITLRNQLATPIKLMGRRVIELYDALIAGNDWEVTPLLSLKRRAGHTAYATINYAAMLLYSWKSNTMGTIPIFDTKGDVEYIGNSGVQVIATKGATTGQNVQSSVLGIGNYLYVGNPQTSFKWDGPSGTQGETNWGVSAVTNFGGSGSASALAGAGTSLSQAGLAPWSNPANVGSNSSFATVTLTPGQYAQFLIATQFGFSGLTGMVAGIGVTFNASTTTPLSTVSGSYMYLFINGSAIGTGVLTPTISASVQPITVGGPTTLWGTSLTIAQLQSSTFGVGFTCEAGTAGTTVQVNDVVMTLYLYAAAQPSPTGSGTFSAVNGYTYVVAYGNSASGEVSNASPPSLSTGPFASAAYVGVPVVASTDPQVNQIRVYRTTDSGGGNQYFEISNSPFANTSTTIQDTTPDTSLQVTSQAEINLGNTPPPAGLINLEWFSGRMWGSTNNLLWASTGPETLSGSAPNSNWNPLFQWVIPGVLVRNVAGPNGMLVFTQDDCYIVRGTDITNYTVNEFVKDFGIRTYNAVDTDGTNIYVFTSDRQFICVSSAGANDLGLAIADQLANVDPTQVYVKVNRYGLDSIVRILDTVNNVYYDYNLNQQCWNLPGILKMSSCTAMGSIETSPGVWRLLLSSTNAGVTQLAYRDITNFLDLGTAYAPNAVFGSIQLADPGSLAKFGSCGGFNLQYTLAGTLPTLSVLPNDIGATLSNAVGSQITGNFVSLSVGTNPLPWPPTLGAQPKGYRNLGYYYAAAKGLSAYLLHLQFQISAPAENTATELIGFGIFGDYKQEVQTAGAIPQLQGR
jgi:hypothetical protein